jgi:hypothetical protein
VGRGEERREKGQRGRRETGPLFAAGDDEDRERKLVLPSEGDGNSQGKLLRVLAAGIA